MGFASIKGSEELIHNQCTPAAFCGRFAEQIFPLFEPVYVFYNESKDSYQHLADVQAEILAASSPPPETVAAPAEPAMAVETAANCPWLPTCTYMMVTGLAAASVLAALRVWVRRTRSF